VPRLSRPQKHPTKEQLHGGAFHTGAPQGGGLWLLNWHPEFEAMTKLESIADAWATLDRHFAHHALLVERFGGASPSAVVRMWQLQKNELGQSLSALEREALKERHCELFGTWPS